MNRFLKYFKLIFPHYLLVVSATLITQWILTLFNPNLGLLSMNNIVVCIEFILHFVISAVGAIFWIIDIYRKK